MTDSKKRKLPSMPFFKRREAKRISQLAKEGISTSAAIIDSFFFYVPFADAGDKTPIPVPIQPSGSVNYTEGFGPDYSADPDIDPDALQVPRSGFNELFFELTLAIQQYQVWGVGNFITDADNGGDPYPYPRWARALFDLGTGDGPQPFFSRIDDNEVAPDDPTNTWQKIDDTAYAVRDDQPVFGTGGAAVVDGDAVYWDSVNKWYAPAIANNDLPMNVVGIADVTNNRVWLAGQVPFPVAAGELTPGVMYLSESAAGALTSIRPAAYAMRVGIARVDSVGITQSLYLDISPDSTAQGLPAGSMLEFAGTVAPTNYLAITSNTQTFATATYPQLYTAISNTWGGDATNAGLPPVCGRSALAAGSGSGVSTRAVAATPGGAETYTQVASDVANHTHIYTEWPVRGAPTTPNNSSGGNGTNNYASDNVNTAGNNPSGPTPMPILNPFYVPLKCIKVNNL